MVKAFAIVPAAGQSARMGAAKLLLDVGGRPLMERVLDSWRASSVTRIVVVVRAEDQPLRRLCDRFAVDIVTTPTATRDMKASVQLGLAYVESHYAPAATDAWMVAPADMPRLSTAIINHVLGAYDPAAPTAVVPTCDGQRAHPVLLPWRCSPLAHRLAPHEGLDALLQQIAVRETAWHEKSTVEDVDTPREYARLLDAISCESKTTSSSTAF